MIFILTKRFRDALCMIIAVRPKQVGLREKIHAGLSTSNSVWPVWLLSIIATTKLLPLIRPFNNVCQVPHINFYRYCDSQMGYKSPQQHE